MYTIHRSYGRETQDYTSRSEYLQVIWLCTFCLGRSRMNVTFPGVSLVSLSRVIEIGQIFKSWGWSHSAIPGSGISHGLQVKPNNIGMFRPVHLCQCHRPCAKETSGLRVLRLGLITRSHGWVCDTVCFAYPAWETFMEILSMRDQCRMCNHRVHPSNGKYLVVQGLGGLYYTSVSRSVDSCRRKFRSLTSGNM